MVVCVKLATQWIILVLHLNVLPIMPNLSSADKRALSDSNLQILFSETCIDQHSCSIHILLAKLGVGGGRGSTLSVFSHPLKSYFILYLSFANDLTRDLCIQNLFMFC